MRGKKALTDIRDMEYVSHTDTVSYIRTGAVSRTRLNCAPLSGLAPSFARLHVRVQVAR